MKIDLLMPHRYSIYSSFHYGFSEIGFEILSSYEELDNCFKGAKGICGKVANLLAPVGLNAQILRWNKKYLDSFSRSKPDIVLIYNHAYLLPETIGEMKKSAKVVVMLGDYPPFSLTYKCNLTILATVDLIVSPDSYWSDEIKKMFGTDVITSSIMPIKTSYRKLSSGELKKFSSVRSHDLLYIGYNHANSWGYKKMLFLDSLSGFDIGIYGTGKGWEEWLPLFPRLKENVVVLSERIPDDILNAMMNKAKLYPVDKNPGLINGFHLRFLECLASGVMPIVEQSNDLMEFSREIDIPMFTKYNELTRLVDEYLQKEELRSRVLEGLISFFSDRYSPILVASKIAERVLT